MDVAVVVPVKRFESAKRRLVGIIDDAQRARLATWMAGRVLDAVAELPTYVACDDDGVRTWAEQRGAAILWGPGLGLNGAVDDAVDRVAAEGFDHVVVSHADLPRPPSLASVATADRITLVPDRRRDGTNVMAFPARTPLRARYGGGSFSRHLEQAHGIAGATVEVRVDRELSLDVDTAADLRHPLIAEVLPSWLRTIPANP